MVYGSDSDEQDKTMHNLAQDIQFDLDVWGSRWKLSRGECLHSTAPVWEAAAVSLQASPSARLSAQRIAQILHAGQRK